MGDSNALQLPSSRRVQHLWHARVSLFTRPNLVEILTIKPSSPMCMPPMTSFRICWNVVYTGRPGQFTRKATTVDKRTKLPSFRQGRTKSNGVFLDARCGIFGITTHDEERHPLGPNATGWDGMGLADKRTNTYRRACPLRLWPNGSTSQRCSHHGAQIVPH